VRRNRRGYLLPTDRRRIDWFSVMAWAAVAGLALAEAGFAVYGFLIWWAGVCP